jgi:NDP-sugar pyrophosphorylase family protein
VEEGDYLGTAGALRLLKGKIKDTFFVSNCDVILENDFKNILLWHKGEKALITLIGCHKEMVVPYGTLSVREGRLASINEKPTYDMIINTGIYVMEPEVIDLIPKGKKIDMNTLIEKTMKKGKISVYPVCEGWHDLGQWKEYRDSLYLLQGGK